LTIFSTSLSVAAFLHRAGGSMLESTGSHGRGIECSLKVVNNLTISFIAESQRTIIRKKNL